MDLEDLYFELSDFEFDYFSDEYFGFFFVVFFIENLGKFIISICMYVFVFFNGFIIKWIIIWDKCIVDGMVG